MTSIEPSVIPATRGDPNAFMKFFVNTTLLGLGCAGLAYYSVLLVEKYQQYRLKRKESETKEESAEEDIVPLMTINRNKLNSDSDMSACDYHRDMTDTTFV